ncbi:hypothetical protein JJD41_10420 [Oxynema sp. CENA135]|uniref:hypothetical protein n=1 Tax=Oxynema sp. CENA135 TaxID=984206 RepID=UPI00190CCC6A|nr:hypothetical protein [Oxynema sp. CENA135]MBK4730273.1 hypothetical protein [Oxynema sp. CENA135]
MAASKTQKGLRGTPQQAKVRVLLTLWDMKAHRESVKKGQLNNRIVRTNERAKDYSPILEELIAQGAISIAKNKVTLLEPVGFDALDAGLRDPEFEFDAQQVSSKLGNALLDWLRQRYPGAARSAGVAPDVLGDGDGHVPGEGDGHVPGAGISSYADFERVTLDLYEQLNRDYNFDRLVPIYRLRREIGDRISRFEFNQWLLEMQTNDKIRLQGSSLPDNDPSKIEDSITTELSGLRCYIKRINA